MKTRLMLFLYGMHFYFKTDGISLHALRMAWAFSQLPNKKLYTGEGMYNNKIGQ